MARSRALTSAVGRGVADQRLGPREGVRLAIFVGGHAAIAVQRGGFGDVRTGEIVQKAADPARADPFEPQRRLFFAAKLKPATASGVFSAIPSNGEIP
jgi:hypothetical protein